MIRDNAGGELADHLDAAARASPVDVPERPERPRLQVRVQATPGGQRLLITERGSLDAAQASGAWLAAHEPVEVRR